MFIPFQAILLKLLLIIATQSCKTEQQKQILINIEQLIDTYSGKTI